MTFRSFSPPGAKNIGRDYPIHGSKAREWNVRGNSWNEGSLNARCYTVLSFSMHWNQQSSLVINLP